MFFSCKQCFTLTDFNINFKSTLFKCFIRYIIFEWNEIAILNHFYKSLYVGGVKKPSKPSPWNSCKYLKTVNKEVNKVIRHKTKFN